MNDHLIYKLKLLSDVLFNIYIQKITDIVDFSYKCLYYSGRVDIAYNILSERVVRPCYNAIQIYICCQILTIMYVNYLIFN